MAAADVAGMMFIPYYRHLMQILETNTELKKTAKGILHQVMYAGVGTAIGGVIAGPPGAMVGGVLGSYLGYRTVNTYESMLEVLRGLSDQEKEELTKKVQELVGTSGIEALTTFVAQQVNREVLMNLIQSFAAQAQKSGG